MESDFETFLLFDKLMEDEISLPELKLFVKELLEDRKKYEKYKTLFFIDKALRRGFRYKRLVCQGEKIMQEIMNKLNS